MNTTQYQEINGTSYQKTTNQEVIDILERLRESQVRITLDYWDVNTGKSRWEVHDISGRIWRSNWQYKVPLLIHNSRSMWWVAILDHCIIGIKESKWWKQLYKLKCQP